MKAFVCVSALGLALAIPFGSGLAQDRSPAGDHPIRLAQAVDTTGTTPSVTTVQPTTTSSATCMAACSTQSLSCSNSCTPTINGTTIMPSMTTVGVTTNPNTCGSNCNSQLTQCQRSCVLQ